DRVHPDYRCVLVRQLPDEPEACVFGRCVERPSACREVCGVGQSEDHRAPGGAQSGRSGFGAEQIALDIDPEQSRRQLVARMSSSDRWKSQIPAFPTKMSRAPNSATAVSTASRLSPIDVTSPSTAHTAWPSSSVRRP